MKIAPTPWTVGYDGHGGIYLDDAEGRQIGFVSARPEQNAHAALFKAAPMLLTALQNLLQQTQNRDGTVQMLTEDAETAIREALG